jgi:hypothetical protein
MLLVSAKDEGNTRKVLEAISASSCAKLVQATDRPVTVGDSKIVVLGSGVYGGKVHRNLVSWVEDLDVGSLAEGTRLYLLLTWIGRGRSNEAAYARFEKVLEKKGLSLQSDCPSCYGQFTSMIRKHHPDETDIRAMVRWAEGVSR